MAWKSYTIIGFLLLVIWGVIFISTMPMRFLADKIQVPPQINVNAISGTLWSGRTEIILRNKLPIIGAPTVLIWKWCPFKSLLTFCLAIDNPDLKGNAHLSYSPINKHLNINDTVLNFVVNKYKFSVKGFPVFLEGIGQINLQALELPIDSPSPFPEQVSADGKLTGVKSGDIQIGDYVWQSGYKGKVLEVDFNGGTSEFNVKGKLALDFDKNNYRYYADLKSESQILFNVLKPYAQQSGKGKITFSNAGRLFG